MSVPCVLQPNTRPCPGEGSVTIKVDWCVLQSPAHHFGTKNQRSCTNPLLPSGGVHSVLWLLSGPQVGRALVSLPPDWVLVLAGSEPYKGASWCLICTQFGAQWHCLAEGRQLVHVLGVLPPPASCVCGLCMTVSTLCFMSQPWPELLDGHLMRDGHRVGTRRGSKGPRTPHNSLHPPC